MLERDVLTNELSAGDCALGAAVVAQILHGKQSTNSSMIHQILLQKATIANLNNSVTLWSNLLQETPGIATSA